MDWELLVIQALLLAVTVVILLAVFWAKLRLERRYRRNSELVKRCMTRAMVVEREGVMLCENMYFDSINRKQRGIIASSLVHYLEEELQKHLEAQDATRSIAQTQTACTFLPLTEAKVLSAVDSQSSTCHQPQLQLGVERRYTGKDYKHLQYRLRSLTGAGRHDKAKKTNQRQHFIYHFKVYYMQKPPSKAN